MGVVAFDAARISDQKRLARGEHWLLTRTILRARDHAHHKTWRVLTMAGGAPAGELSAIRELMPKASIVATDRDAACLEAAIDGGADDVVQVDDVLRIDRMLKPTIANHYSGPVVRDVKSVAAPIAALPRFDVVNLDMCCGASEELQESARLFMRTMVTPGGVFMVTLSYGRDVSEVYTMALRRFGRSWVNVACENDRKALPADLPDSVAGRIIYLFGADSLMNTLRSIIVYRGSEMPMCALLFEVSRVRLEPISYVRVEPGDFELSVCHPDVSRLYDCPENRIESLRRQFAALKAAMTRKAAESKKDQLFA